MQTEHVNSFPNCTLLQEIPTGIYIAASTAANSDYSAHGHTELFRCRSAEEANAFCTKYRRKR